LFCLLPRSRAPPHLPSFPTRRSSDLRLDSSVGDDPILPATPDVAKGPGTPHITAAPRGPGVGSEVMAGTPAPVGAVMAVTAVTVDRKSTRLNSSHVKISYAAFRLKKK